MKSRKTLGFVILVIAMGVGMLWALTDMMENPPFSPLVFCLLAPMLAVVRSVRIMWPFYLLSLVLMDFLRSSPKSPKQGDDE